MSKVETFDIKKFSSMRLPFDTSTLDDSRTQKNQWVHFPQRTDLTLSFLQYTNDSNKVHVLVGWKGTILELVYIYQSNESVNTFISKYPIIGFKQTSKFGTLYKRFQVSFNCERDYSLCCNHIQNLGITINKLDFKGSDSQKVNVNYMTGQLKESQDVSRNSISQELQISPENINLGPYSSNYMLGSLPSDQNLFPSALGAEGSKFPNNVTQYDLGLKEVMQQTQNLHEPMLGPLALQFPRAMQPFFPLFQHPLQMASGTIPNTPAYQNIPFIYNHNNMMEAASSMLYQQKIPQALSNDVVSVVGDGKTSLPPKKFKQSIEQEGDEKFETSIATYPHTSQSPGNNFVDNLPISGNDSKKYTVLIQNENICHDKSTKAKRVSKIKSSTTLKNKKDDSWRSLSKSNMKKLIENKLKDKEFIKLVEKIDLIVSQP